MLSDSAVTRIGTWNLEGRWSPAHELLLLGMDADVLLLTEVRVGLSLPGYDLHPTERLMAERRHWAAVAARSPLIALPEPHPATAAVRVGATTFCSSILPWRGATGPIWGEKPHADRTHRTLELLTQALPSTDLVWGGDWNHALDGPEYAGSRGGRSHLLESVNRLGLQVPTADLPHQKDGLLSIDHVAVPVGCRVTSVHRWSARTPDGHLSDHDAYSVDVTL